MIVVPSSGAPSMKRTLAAVLSAALLVSGCATSQSVIPPGEDPQQLVETINRRAQTTGPMVADPPETPSFAGRLIVTSAKVGATCLLVSFVLLACSTKGGHPSGIGLDQALRNIWAAD
jgi:predicted small secreted protein